MKRSVAVAPRRGREQAEKMILTCHHYWLIEKATGPKSRGECKYCGTRKDFSNFIPDFTLFKTLYNGLVRIDPDSNQIVGDLAESWEVSDDGVTWTFKLKENVKFADGTDFNAEAAKYSFDKMRDEDFGAAYYSQFSIIQDVSVVDDYTVQLTTDKPFSPLLISLSHPVAAMVSPTAYDKYGEDFASHPTGTGAYLLKSWEGETVILERNPYYTGEPPWPDEIKFIAVAEAGTRVAMLENKEVDIITTVPPQDVERLRANSNLRIESFPSLLMPVIEVNCLKGPLQNKLVRQAIMYAIDRQAIVEGIMLGFAAEPRSVIAIVPHYKSFDPWPYDPEKAKELLSEAGYPNGFDITLWTSNSRALQGEAVQGYLGAVGINADLTAWDWPPYLEKTMSPAKPEDEKDLWIVGRGTMGADFWMYRLFYSQSSNNVYGYANPAVDELLRGRHWCDEAKEYLAVEGPERVAVRPMEGGW